MVTFSNRDIVRDLKNGTRSGCTRLVDNYQARLIGEATHVFRLSTEDAEEVVSDVLFAVVKNIHSFSFKRRDDDFHVWVISVFRNKVRDFLRRRAVAGRLFEPLDEVGGDGEVDAECLLSETVMRQYQETLLAPEGDNGNAAAEKLLAIADALECLEPWERVLLRCRALDVPYDDIARYTGKPVKQLKVYHARVKKKFMKILSEYFPELDEHATFT